MTTQPLIKSGLPHTFGWLRRPECDVPGGQTWEAPCGRLFAYPADKVAIVFVVDGEIWHDKPHEPPGIESYYDEDEKKKAPPPRG